MHIVCGELGDVEPESCWVSLRELDERHRWPVGKGSGLGEVADKRHTKWRDGELMRWASGGQH